MRRRDFIGAIYGIALASPGGAIAQQSGKVWRIGDVLPSDPAGHWAQALEQHLAERGYVEGGNLVLLNRFTGPQPDKIEEAVVSLAPQVDLLVVWGSIAGMAAKKFAGGVPTVFLTIGFPVELGLVRSLARPGGNITGITAEAALETYGKRLQILKEIVPGLKRSAVLRAPDDPNVGFAMTSLEQAARELAVTLFPVDIRSAGDLEAAFASMKKDEAGALIVIATALAVSLGREIADLALAARLPTCSDKDGVMAGALVSLYPDRTAMTGPAAVQIDKIIKGTSPADIPVEQPTRYELDINLKTARLLNLTIPPALLARADELIE
jgi:putative ABC transport system substrate-binding protein